MNYSDARPLISSGDIIALSHHEWNSIYDLQVQAVRVFTQSEYCHVAIAWVVGGRVFLIEAVEPYVRIFPLSNLTNGFYWIPVATPISDAELELGLKQVGVGHYSKLEAIKAQLNMLDIGKDDLWECAELTLEMRKLSGLVLGNKATPAAIVQEALKQGFQLHYIDKG